MPIGSLEKVMNKTHGMSRGPDGKGTPIYRCWIHMRERCNKPNTKGYEWYGGRGIKVCPQWNNSFETFYADMGDRPDGLTLDRKDNDGDYTPDNCRWATPLEQTLNRRENKKKPPRTVFTKVVIKKVWALSNHCSTREIASILKVGKSQVWRILNP